MKSIRLLLLVFTTMIVLLASCSSVDEPETELTEKQDISTDSAEVVEEYDEMKRGWNFIKTGSLICNSVSNNSYSDAIVYELGGKMGIVDNDGNSKLEPKYDSIAMQDALYCNSKSDDQGKSLLRVSDGEVIFDDYVSVTDGLAINSRKGIAEVFDIATGETILFLEIPEDRFVDISVTDTCIYTLLYTYTEYPRINGEIRIYDKSGKLIYNDTDVTRYEVQKDNPNHIYWEKGKYPDSISYIEVDGKVYSNTELEQDGQYSVSFAEDSVFNKEYKMYRYCDRETGNYGIMSLLGKVIIPAQYEHCSVMNNGIIRVSNEDNYDGFYTCSGEKLSDCIYSYYGERFYDGVLSVAMGDYWGIMNKEGVLVYPTQIERDRYSAETHEAPAYFLEGNQVLNYETGEIRKYASLEYVGFPEGLFMYKKVNGACGLSTYKEEVIEFENAEIFCTKDEKVLVVKQFNEYTFYEIEKTE